MALEYINTEYLDRDQSRILYRLIGDRYKISNAIIMENCGRTVINILTDLISPPSKICIFSGVGNKGGIGFVIARHLAILGYDVLVFAASKTSGIYTDTDIENNRKAFALAKSLREQGLSYGKIADQLNDYGFKTRHNRSFFANSVRQLLNTLSICFI